MLRIVLNLLLKFRDRCIDLVDFQQEASVSVMNIRHVGISLCQAAVFLPRLTKFLGSSEPFCLAGSRYNLARSLPRWRKVFRADPQDRHTKSKNQVISFESIVAQQIKGLLCGFKSVFAQEE